MCFPQAVVGCAPLFESVHVVFEFFESELVRRVVILWVTVDSPVNVSLLVLVRREIVEV